MAKKKRKVRLRQMPHQRPPVFLPLPQEFQDVMDRLDGKKLSLDEVLAQLRPLAEQYMGKIGVVEPQEGSIRFEYQKGGFRCRYELFRYG